MVVSVDGHGDLVVGGVWADGEERTGCGFRDTHSRGVGHLFADEERQCEVVFRYSLNADIRIFAG